MKALSILAIILTITSCSFSPQGLKFPLGTWQLVEWQTFSGDSVTELFPGEWTGSDVVIIGERHIFSVGTFKNDTSIFNNYVGVSYTLDGNHLEETIMYFPNPDFIGQKVKQILEMRGDTLYKSYPCDDNWVLNKSSYNVEKYVRMK